MHALTSSNITRLVRRYTENQHSQLGAHSSNTKLVRGHAENPHSQKYLAIQKSWEIDNTTLYLIIFCKLSEFSSERTENVDGVAMDMPVVMRDVSVKLGPSGDYEL